jgi:hypothetical protein
VGRVPTPLVSPTSPITHRERHDPDVEAYRTQFKALNEEISILQQDTFGDISKAEPMLGWILVGRGLEWVPDAQIIKGRTREDILWANIGHERGEKRYFLEVIVIGFIFFLFSESAHSFIPDSTSFGD